MKKYKTLLFDIDDTLLDFNAAESLALRLLFEEQSLPLSTEMELHYKKLNKDLWTSYEEGRINREEVLNKRFSILFKEYGHDVDGALLEKKYRNFLQEGHQLINGAFELITDLRGKYDLYIVTNGVFKTQNKRLRDSGLFPLFNDIFVSEQTGYQKPMKEFFDYVFERIPNFSKKQSLIIGDSLSADIKGAEQTGIDSCWFNPEMKTNNTDISPTYQIQNLNELYQILR